MRFEDIFCSCCDDNRLDAAYANDMLKLLREKISEALSTAFYSGQSWECVLRDYDYKPTEQDCATYGPDRVLGDLLEELGVKP